MYFTILLHDGLEASCAADLQRAAEAMIREAGGKASHLTHKIASAGTHGKFPNNVPRDISRALRLPLEIWQHTSVHTYMPWHILLHVQGEY